MVCRTGGKRECMRLSNLRKWAGYAASENAASYANGLSKVYELFMTDLPVREEIVYTK